MRWQRIFLYVAGAAALAVGAATADDEARSEDRIEDRIEKRIEKRLDRDGRLEDLEVDVDAHRVATLKGKVSREVDRARAERLARVEGVKKVDNRIEIEGKKAIGVEAAEELGDAWITTKIKAQLMGEDRLEAGDIDVDTDKDGVVTLTGTVPTESARTRVVEIARTTKGVRQINDQLKVAKGPADERTP